MLAFSRMSEITARDKSRDDLAEEGVCCICDICGTIHHPRAVLVLINVCGKCESARAAGAACTKKKSSVSIQFYFRFVPPFYSFRVELYFQGEKLSGRRAKPGNPRFPWLDWRLRPLITHIPTDEQHYTWHLKRKTPCVPDVYFQEMYDLNGKRYY